MILFAEVTDTGLAAIGSAIALGWGILRFIEKMYDNRRADRIAASIAAKVETVRTDTIAEAQKVATKVAEVKGAVIQTARVADEHREEIKVALESHNALQAENICSLSSQLTKVVQKVEDVGFAKGVKSETDKTEDKISKDM